MKINIKKVLLVGGVVCGFASVGLLTYDNLQLRRELHSEMRTVYGRLAETESKVYCNSKWIKDLQEDTTDADAISEIDKRLTRLEYNSAEDIEEVKALLDALKASETDAEEVEGINAPSPLENVTVNEIQGQSGVLTATGGVNWYNGHKETYYNFSDEKMLELLQYVRNCGVDVPGDYWIREDGCKMVGDYIILACNRDVYPWGSIVETSLGTGISLDTGAFADINPTQVDIAVGW